MKSVLSAVCLPVVASLAAYAISYFICVSQISFGMTRGEWITVAPTYRYMPACIDATELYRPIHMIDRAWLRHSKWETRRAKPGELSGEVIGSRRVLFSVPYKDAR